jgi:hypothetical protein
MKWLIKTAALMCCAILHLSAVESSVEEIVAAIRSTGYYEFSNRHLSKEFYADIYASFESFLQEIDENPLLYDLLKKAETDFVMREEFNYLGKSPVGLIGSDKSGKKDKIYYHFSKELLEFFKSSFPEILENRICFDLFSKLSEVSAISNRYFKEYIEQLKDVFPTLPAVMLKNGDLPIIIKVIRYEVNLKYVGSPHYDYSGLTLMLDNSDVGVESLVLTPYSENLNWDEFHRPLRTASGGLSSTLLIPGLGLYLSGIDLMPSPHVVLKRKKIRYALLAFGMVPDLVVTTEQIRIKDVAGSIPEN